MKKFMRVLPLLIPAGLILLGSGCGDKQRIESGSQGQIAVPTPAWEISFEKEIRWHKITPAGNLVVGTADGILGIDPEDGRAAWQLGDVGQPQAGEFELVSYSPFALLSVKKKLRGELPLVIMVDVIDGRELWSTEKAGLGNSYGYIPLPQIGGIMIYGTMAADPKQKVAMAFDLETGNLLWEVKDFFKDAEPIRFDIGGKQTIVGNQPPLFDTEESMVLFLTWKSIRKYAVRTGELLWENRENLGMAGYRWFQEKPDRWDAPALAYGFAHMQLSESGDRFFAPHQNTVGAFSTADGQPLWEERPNLDGRVVQMAVIPEGLVVRTNPLTTSDGPHWVMLLDKSTGKILWKSPRRKGSIFHRMAGKWSTSTDFDILDEKIMLSADGQLFSIDIATGEETSLGKLKFKDSEEAASFEMMENGCFVSSMQNAALYGFDGTRKYHVYHEAPDDYADIFGAILSSLAKDIADEIVAHALTEATGVTFEVGYDENKPSRTFGYYHATAETKDHIYMLANIGEGERNAPGLLKIDKLNGQTVGRIILDTREPDYILDEFSGRLFFKSASNSIACYEF